MIAFFMLTDAEKVIARKLMNEYKDQGMSEPDAMRRALLEMQAKMMGNDMDFPKEKRP